MQAPSEHFELSFLITFCSQKEYARQLIDSLLAQETVFPFEILVGVDGEDDGIVDILDSYVEKYPFIKYYRLNSDSRLLSLSTAYPKDRQIHSIYSVAISHAVNQKRMFKIIKIGVKKGLYFSMKSMKGTPISLQVHQYL